jgi:sensor c-di-GMP phosphodiesterase-like protein
MKFNNISIIASMQRRFSQAIGGLLIMVTLWQGIALGVDVAIAAPLVANNSSMANRVDTKIDEAKDRSRSAMKDINKSTDKNMSKAKNAMDKNAKKVENSIKDSTKKAKNFLGF